MAVGIGKIKHMAKCSKARKEKKVVRAKCVNKSFRKTDATKMRVCERCMVSKLTNAIGVRFTCTPCKNKGRVKKLRRTKFVDRSNSCWNEEVATADEAPSWIQLMRISTSSMSPPQPEGRPRNDAAAPKAFNGAFAVTAIPKGTFFELHDYVILKLTCDEELATRSADIYRILLPNRKDGFMRFIAPKTMPPRGNTTEKMFYINSVSTTGKARYRDVGAENMSFDFKKAPFGFRAKRDIQANEELLANYEW